MSKKILVVDDSSFQRTQIIRALHSSGFSTQEACNGVQALEVLSKNKFDLIITDLLMPEMDGIELLKQIGKKNILIPVVVLTADIQEPVKQECLDLGAKGFLNKPFKTDVLIETISKL